MRRGNKDRDRYVSFDGTDEIVAGNRIKPKKAYIPTKYILAPEGKGWEQWVGFFENTPEAGKQAEKDFVRLSTGIDDENLTELETDTETYVKEKTNKTAIATTNNSETRPRIRQISVKK
jgi:hypothetical protein